MSDLIVIERGPNTKETFMDKDGLKPYLDSIRREIDNFSMPDLSDKDGRKAVNLFKRKIAMMKNKIDNLGLEVVTELKLEPKIIDSNRKHARDTISKWISEFIKPMEEWEEKDAERINDIHHRINAISKLKDDTVKLSALALKNRLDDAARFPIEHSLMEFIDYGQQTKEKTMLFLSQAYEIKSKAERDAKELAELKAANDKLRADQEAEKKRQDKIKADQEAAIKAEQVAKEREQKAAENARVAAEEKADQDEMLRLQRDAREELELRLKSEGEAKERAEKDAENAIIAAEDKARREQAALELKLRSEREAKERAEKEVEKARQEGAKRVEQEMMAEQDRLREIEKQEQAAYQARIDNENHRRECNKSALSAILEHKLMPEDKAKALINLIYNNKIPFISINY